jgi:hypothetical protein
VEKSSAKARKRTGGSGNQDRGEKDIRAAGAQVIEDDWPMMILQVLL